MKRIFIFIFLIFIALSTNAQQTVSGVVRDVTTGEGLVGAIVVVDGGKFHAVADLDGNYSISLADGQHLLLVKYTGYNADSFNIKIAGRPIIHDFNCTSTTLKEVEIVSDVAVDRKTPVAFSNINVNKIREEGGGRDFTMLLNSTPGAYATEQGGGAGDSRVNIRGVDQRNVGVMVDGVPMNDMENGQVYWSNWEGLSDVTRTMQVQRGLGASKLAIPSVGGTINILTQGIDQKKSFSVSTQYGNNSSQKLAVGFNSGEFGKGWGVTFAGSRKTGEGWADQTWEDSWSYFFKVQKRVNKNLFSLSFNGAPQTHSQRYDRMNAAIYDRGFAEKLGIDVDSVYRSNNGYTTFTQGERGLRYNPNWGYLVYADGQSGRISQDVNLYNKPLTNLSWYFTPNDKFSVATTAYLSIGHGGGTNFNSAVNRDTLTGQQTLTAAYTSNSTFIDANYSTTEHKSSRYLLASMNDHVWYGALSTATWTPSNKYSVLFGVDLRHYEGSHYRKGYDLLGGDYFIDGSDKNQPNGVGNLQYSMKTKGDKVGYYNVSYVDWAGIFAQGEYTGTRWSAFVTVTGSATQYQRVDHFKKRDITLDDGTIVPMIVGYNEVYYTNGSSSGVAQNNAIITQHGDTTIIDNPTGPNDTIVGGKSYAWSSSSARTATTVKKTFPGFTIKSGANYNIDENFNVFMNVGYLNMAPRFNTVFDNNNKAYPKAKQQIVYAFELGAGAKFGTFAANLNMYYTNWKNKPPYGSPTTTVAGDPYTYDIDGLNTQLIGIEFDGNWKPTKNLQIEALASIGNWKYNAAGTVYLYDANYTLADSIAYSAKGVHMGDAAQTQFGGAVRWSPIKGFYVKPRYTFFGRNYANFDPIVLVPIYNANHVQVGDNRDHESWLMPSYGLVDLNFGYEIREHVSPDKNRPVIVNFTFSINNLLNKVYISDGQNGAGFDASSSLVYLGMGRRWTAGMRFTF